MVTNMRDDLAEFGVHYDNWFSERQFVTPDVIAQIVKKLREQWAHL